MKNLMFVKVDQGVELHPLISVHQYYYTFCYTKGITFNVHPPPPSKQKQFSVPVYMLFHTDISIVLLLFQFFNIFFFGVLFISLIYLLVAL